ncbi:MAG: hypothetical protein CW346_13270 [Bacillaceae bacterium]|nr:hypothetical protein [Bacillaceae bacterium]
MLLPSVSDGIKDMRPATDERRIRSFLPFGKGKGGRRQLSGPSAPSSAGAIGKKKKHGRSAVMTE